MKPTWIVVANSAQARFFTADTATGPLAEFHDLVHGESRLHARELTSDLPGKNVDSHGGGLHGMEARTPVKKHEREVFAREVASYLTHARNSGEFDRLIVVAAPAFLGELRATIDKNTLASVSSWIEKNLTKDSAEDIRASLPDRLWRLGE